jgi:hypothetical protein
VNRVLVLVEGQTEETFFNHEIAPHLCARNVDARCTRICTQEEDGRRVHRGGHAHNWHKIESDLRRLLGSKPDLVSTMIDMYRFPRNLPGFPDPWPGNTPERVDKLSAAFAAAIGDYRFHPGLMVHEFEALLFSDPDKLVDVVELDDRKVGESKRSLQDIRRSFKSPEDIDDGPETAPSKRIVGVLGRYDKALHGPRVASAIGLSNLRAACPYFNQWLERLEQVAG